MRLSCSSLFLWEYRIDEIMEILQDAGIKSVEFWAETPDFWMKREDEDTLSNLKKAISKMPDGCTLHAPILDLNPTSINWNVHELTIKETLWCLELAKKINARLVTIHAGKRTVLRPPLKEEHEKFLRYLKICTKKANELGVNLALENNMSGISRLCSLPFEIKEVMLKFPSLYFTLDIVHAYMVSPQNVLSFIEELNNKIINVHIGAFYKGKAHYPLHRAKNMNKILISLFDSGYNKDLTLEIDDKVYSNSLTRLEKIEELKKEKKYIETFSSY